MAVRRRVGARHVCRGRCVVIELLPVLRCDAHGYDTPHEATDDGFVCAVCLHASVPLVPREGS